MGLGWHSAPSPPLFSSLIHTTPEVWPNSGRVLFCSAALMMAFQAESSSG